MTLPNATTRISVLRKAADATRDPYDTQPAATAVATGIRAHISAPMQRSDEEVHGGSQEVVQFPMHCDPVDLRHTDQVEDEATGEVYEVVWARQRLAMPGGLDHVEAELKQVSGLA